MSRLCMTRNLRYAEPMSVQTLVPGEVTLLLEELADAALDSAEVLLGWPCDEDRETHSRYLQDLHRVAQAALAQLCSGGVA